MFVLVVYDVPASRTHVYRKLLRRRLEHIQQSVFYGDITEGQLVGLKADIESKIESDDSIIVFSTEVADSVEQTVYGSAEKPGSRFT
jgi:CRISPR-associated protein Cas2